MQKTLGGKGVCLGKPPQGWGNRGGTVPRAGRGLPGARRETGSVSPALAPLCLQSSRRSAPRICPGPTSVRHQAASLLPCPERRGLDFLRPGFLLTGTSACCWQLPSIFWGGKCRGHRRSRALPPASFSASGLPGCSGSVMGPRGQPPRLASLLPSGPWGSRHITLSLWR